MWSLWIFSHSLHTRLRLEAELEQLQGEFWKTSVCCSGCSHLHLLQTVPCLKKKKFQIRKFIGDRYRKPPAVSARDSYSRGRSCMAVIVESLFVQNVTVRVFFLFITEFVVRTVLFCKSGIRTDRIHYIPFMYYQSNMSWRKWPSLGITTKLQLARQSSWSPDVDQSHRNMLPR